MGRSRKGGAPNSPGEQAKGVSMNTERYREHLRPQASEERSKLEESIKAEGCRDPLVLGVLEGERYLIDGFNRKAICDASGIPYQTVEIPFASHEDVLNWIERNAQARRNQTRTERLYYLGSRYNREKGPAHRPSGKRSQNDSVSEDRTRDRIATEEKVSPKTVQRAGKLASHLDEAAGCGLLWAKWLILSERIKYSQQLLDTMIEMGSGGCKEQVEALLSTSPEAVISPAKVLAALDPEPDEPISKVGVGRTNPKHEKVLDQIEKLAGVADQPMRFIASIKAKIQMLETMYRRQEA